MKTEIFEQTRWIDQKDVTPKAIHINETIKEAIKLTEKYCFENELRWLRKFNLKELKKKEPLIVQVIKKRKEDLEEK